MRLSQASAETARIPLADLEERAEPEDAEFVERDQPVTDVPIGLRPFLLSYVSNPLFLIKPVAFTSVEVDEEEESSEEESTEEETSDEGADSDEEISEEESF